MRNMFNKNSGLYMLIAIMLAIVLALFMPELAVHLEIGGEIFIKLLKMIVVPLVVISVMSGILSMGDVRQLGSSGSIALFYYLFTTLIAVFIGLFIVQLLQPGGDVSVNSSEMVFEVGDSYLSRIEDNTIGGILKNLLLLLFTDNLFTSAAENNFLPLIVFAIFFASSLSMIGEKSKTLINCILQCNQALLHFVLIIMKIAPIGIFCLVASNFGELALNDKLDKAFSQTSSYFFTVMTGLGIHACIVLPLILLLVARRNPLQFIQQIYKALLVGFSTASSSATLPVTLHCAINKAKVSKRSSELVLPIGSTVNMDGTALYEAVAAIFIAQVYGIDLTITQQLLVAITATIAAIGAAGVPEAGIVTMVIVFNTVGLPLEGIGIILVIDWLLDRFRTAVNIAGDLVGAAVVDRKTNN